MTNIIALDGTSGSGKGTVAKIVAKQLKYEYLDTGRMFRIVAHHCIDKKINIYNKDDVACLAKMVDVFCKKFDSELMDDTVSYTSSIIAMIPEVRKILHNAQRKFSLGKKGVVADGRDIGTIVFPNAQFKFFFDAKIEERANRRYKQLQISGKSIIFGDVLRHMKSRDERDLSRFVAPLKPAEGCIKVDTTSLGIDDVVKIVLNKVRFLD